MTTRIDDALYTAVDTTRTKSAAYTTAYVNYQSCMNTYSGNSTAQSSNCGPMLQPAITASNEYNTQLTDTATVANARALGTTYMNGTVYATSKTTTLAKDASNRKKQQELQDIEEGTEYAMAKREADAVVYAWTLWVLVFFITATAVFMYT
jgi:hypothetical protein